MAALVACVLVVTAVAVGVSATPTNATPINCDDPNDQWLPICHNELFVTRSGKQMMLGGYPFIFTGVNIYNANNRGDCWYALNDDPLLADSLDALAPGSVVRAWFFQPLATTNGARDWSAFDNTLQLAAATPPPCDSCPRQRVGRLRRSNGGAGVKKLDTWFADGYRTDVHPGGTVDYRSWVAEVASRYAADPTIVTWQLMNEAEIIHRDASGVESCPAGAANTLHDFAADVSSVIKQVDPNHLVSLGTIGTGQCGAQGAEYSYVHSVPSIDLCEYHDYGSPNVPIPGDEFNGLLVRLNQCDALGKPLFVGEVGINPQDTFGLEGRADAFHAKLNAQFTSFGIPHVAGVIAWALNTDWSTLDDFDMSPRDPVITNFNGAPLPPPTNTLHVSVEGNGAGTIWRRVGGPGCTGNCIAEVNVGDTVTLTAQPQAALPVRRMGWV